MRCNCLVGTVRPSVLSLGRSRCTCLDSGLWFWASISSGHKSRFLPRSTPTASTPRLFPGTSDESLYLPFSPSVKGQYYLLFFCFKKSQTNPSLPSSLLRHARMGRVSKRRQADASSDEEVAQPSKKTKTKTAAEPGKDDEGNPFWPVCASLRFNRYISRLSTSCC